MTQKLSSKPGRRAKIGLKRPITLTTRMQTCCRKQRTAGLKRFSMSGKQHMMRAFLGGKETMSLKPMRRAKIGLKRPIALTTHLVSPDTIIFSAIASPPCRNTTGLPRPCRDPNQAHGPHTQLLSHGIRDQLCVYLRILSMMMDEGYYASASAYMKTQLSDLRRQTDSKTSCPYMCIEDFVSVIRQIQRCEKCQEPLMLPLPVVVSESMNELEKLDGREYDKLLMSRVGANEGAHD